MKTTKTIFECRICGRVSLTEEEDTFCEGLPIVGENLFFQVGDVVAIGRGFPTIATIIAIGYKRLGSRTGPSVHRLVIFTQELGRKRFSGDSVRSWHTPESLAEIHHKWWLLKKENLEESRASKVLKNESIVNLLERGYQPAE